MKMILQGTPQVLTGSSLANLLYLLSAHKVEKSHWSKLPALIFWSTLLSPLYWLEGLLFASTTKSAIHPEPIFIIGHWRSGTTYLHYLLANDNQFGYCSNADAFMPGALFTCRWLTRKILSLRLPKTRPMDNVNLHVDAPQEEEFALMLLTPFSVYHAFVFPRSFREQFLTSLMPRRDDNSVNGWSHHYNQFIKKISRRYGGKRLLLKNPANTGRILLLTRMFPNAKFIYLHREPAEVKQSTLRMFKAMTQINTLQNFQESVLAEEIEMVHQKLLDEYEINRHYIVPDNLVEIDYKDLVENPLMTIKRVYDTLKLSGFESSQPYFERFIEEQKNYKPHEYSPRTSEN